MASVDASTLRRVSVAGSRLKFAAAHMATFGGDCEPLHGHNYAVRIEVEGDLTEDAWLVDFGLLKRLGGDLCAELDHKFLLQTRGTFLRIQRFEGAYEIGAGPRVYRFPEEDVFELPADNSTAERIAEYLWEQLRERVSAIAGLHLARLAVEVEEAPGQSALFAASTA